MEQELLGVLQYISLHETTEYSYSEYEKPIFTAEYSEYSSSKPGPEYCTVPCNMDILMQTTLAISSVRRSIPLLE
jgi:hypothetical protein